MKTVVLTFDDAVRNHRNAVAPLLRRFHAGATFFICRFSDVWREKNESALMTGKEVAELAEFGFEIGNHTWNHPDLRNCAPAQIASEIDRMTDFLRSAGIPGPEFSFAYPGGPYAENARPLLEDRGFRLARTTEHRAWDVRNDDPLRVPAVPIQGDHPELFRNALSLCTDERPVVLVFHGVPDSVHPFVSTPLPVLESYLKELDSNGYQMMSMRDCYRSFYA